MSAPPRYVLKLRHRVRRDYSLSIMLDADVLYDERAHRLLRRHELALPEFEIDLWRGDKLVAVERFAA